MNWTVRCVQYVNITLWLCLQVVRSLFTKTKKVVTGLDEECGIGIVDLTYRNESIARGEEKLWTARFMQK